MISDVRSNGKCLTCSSWRCHKAQPNWVLPHFTLRFSFLPSFLPSALPIDRRLSRLVEWFMSEMVQNEHDWGWYSRVVVASSSSKLECVYILTFSQLRCSWLPRSFPLHPAFQNLSYSTRFVLSKIHNYEQITITTMTMMITAEKSLMNMTFPLIIIYSLIDDDDDADDDVFCPPTSDDSSSKCSLLDVCDYWVGRWMMNSFRVALL